MSRYYPDEGELQEYKRDRFMERMELDTGNLRCDCTESNWRCVETYAYGDDADGNRGQLRKLYECATCGTEADVSA